MALIQFAGGAIGTLVAARCAGEWDERLDAYGNSTSVRVVAGSTRQVTKEQRAAMLKQYYTEVFMPIYLALNRWDLAVRYAEQIGSLIGLGDAKNYLPTKSKALPPAKPGAIAPTPQIPATSETE